MFTCALRVHVTALFRARPLPRFRRLPSKPEPRKSNFQYLIHSLAPMASQSSTHYDAIVIGSGQAGTPLSSALQKAGHRTLLIDRAYLGGCCVNVGCTPTKTLIASGKSAYSIRRGKDYGVNVVSENEDGSSQETSVVVDMKKVRQRKRDIVDSFRGGSERRVKDAGVDVWMGEASFVDEKTVRVKGSEGDEKTVTGERFFINVGERPASPQLSGIETIDKNLVLDSTSIQELDYVPDHLIVVGGGYVGVEFAQLFRRLGATVTIIQRGKQLLPREDPEIASELLKILEEDGITIHLESKAQSIEPYSHNQSSRFKLQISTMSGFQSLEGSAILFAAGRVPNTDSLNISAAGIKVNNKGYIECNEHLETSTPNIYALGDVKGPPAFTHISYDDFRIISHNLISSTATTTKLSTANRLVPYVVYTDPQLGHIGLHEHEARVLHPGKGEIQSAKMPMSYVARALETDEPRGVMKAVVEKETGLILGFTCLGMEGGELMAVVQMAMVGKVRWEVLRDAVWAHPSLAESLNNLWGFLE